VDSVSREKAKELTEDALNKLLDHLHPERSEAGERYEGIRRKLVQFFRWERAEFPEEHADEALNRVARKLAAGEPIVDVERYIFGVARMISHEIAQQRVRHKAAVEEMKRAPAAQIDAEEVALAAVLWECLLVLPPDMRTFILRYYEGDKQVRIRNRRAMSEELGIPLNALRNRALRLRERLEDCVQRRRPANQGEMDRGFLSH
jgi:DNA-directed RNA polymerase specialized sigma24 family protein